MKVPVSLSLSCLVPHLTDVTWCDADASITINYYYLNVLFSLHVCTFIIGHCCTAGVWPDHLKRCVCACGCCDRACCVECQWGLVVILFSFNVCKSQLSACFVVHFPVPSVKPHQWRTYPCAWAHNTLAISYVQCSYFKALVVYIWGILFCCA